MELGRLDGMRGLEVNPQGKMPVVMQSKNGGCTRVRWIARFLGASSRCRRPVWATGSVEPAFEGRLRLCRHHDVYLAPIQGGMYKASPAGPGRRWMFHT